MYQRHSMHLAAHVIKMWKPTGIWQFRHTNGLLPPSGTVCVVHMSAWRELELLSAFETVLILWITKTVKLTFALNKSSPYSLVYNVFYVQKMTFYIKMFFGTTLCEASHLFQFYGRFDLKEKTHIVGAN